MDLYTSSSYEIAKRLTKRYSTSFSMSSQLFAASIRPHIYAIYGLVRIADEIVDTYRGIDAKQRLDALQTETMSAISSQYSTNPIVHAFAKTATRYHIDETLIAPFFDSMRMDLAPQKFDSDTYATYIYGSAEVVGLMCLKVFVDGDTERYAKLREGAQSLGAAYQKVNFLRDIRADHEELGRTYFPGVEFASFNDTDKQTILAEIEQDFADASSAIDDLPPEARRAVRASYYYYSKLLHKLKRAPTSEITLHRIRVSNPRKFTLLIRAAVGL